MKLIRWSFYNIHMPMMEDQEGELFCTSLALCTALHIDESTLRSTYERNKVEFDGNCVSQRDAIEFLKRNRTEFGLRYIRGDMRLWSEDDMLTVAFHSRSETSIEFRRHLRQFIKANAKKDVVERSVYEALIRDNEVIQGRLTRLEEAVLNARPAAQIAASAAGAALAAQKGTRKLRLVT